MSMASCLHGLIRHDWALVRWTGNRAKELTPLKTPYDEAHATVGDILVFLASFVKLKLALSPTAIWISNYVCLIVGKLDCQLGDCTCRARVEG